VKKDVAQVEVATLPGILRDKQEDWDAGVKKLTAATLDYEKAVAENDEQAMLDSVEALHGEFESLIRLVRPRSAELEAYHVVLYQVYHHQGPEKQLAALRPATVELGTKCEVLAKGEAPRRIAGDEAKVAAYRAGVTDLCAKTQDLAKVAEGDDWKAINQAIETVHTQYQAVERLID
jgi:soluble cytochrome b562